jgi:hypothetical protein
MRLPLDRTYPVSGTGRLRRPSVSVSALHGAGKVVLGDRTGSREFAGEIAQEHPSPEILFIDEHMSSMEGRRRYLLDHPRPGLGRLIPVSLRVPGEPFDDYVAVVLAERFFQCLKR